MAHARLPGVDSEATPRINAGAKLGLVHIVSLNSSPVAFFHRDHLLATKITINTNTSNINIVESRARHRAFLVAEPPSKEEGFHSLLPRKPRRATTPDHGFLKGEADSRGPRPGLPLATIATAPSAHRARPDSLPRVDRQFALTHTERRSRLVSVSRSTSPADQIATWIFVNNATTTSSWRTYTSRTRMRRCARSKRYSLACCLQRR